ncbi:hypothetical protein GTQ34_05445 [Muricauda sp. JGD-17]|uniref:Uncharacterized protein n=2 Tax=Flagellimonas ochracea TaxID=2696472 RepID=A0A964WX20_9FLAO|nr:hypothetical protein [Allomuricauda ochracea]
MNATKSNPRTAFLLGVGLDKLHNESREWLSTIAFWKDETKFFARILKKKDFKNHTTSEYGKILNNLDKVHADLFDYLSDDIIAHEKLLARLIKGEKGIADEDYREQHHKLSSRMDTFTNDFRVFKKMVFGYVTAL